VLGAALIAVSFLYQYCKKKGFFKAQLLEPLKDKDPAKKKNLTP